MLLKQRISNKDLNWILKRFNLGKIISVSPMPTSGNVSYIIKTGSKNYFLRLCPNSGPRFRSINEILAEIELLYLLKSRNFPVLIPLKDREGREIISFRDYSGYIREFSEDYEKNKPTLEEIRKFGQTLGKFHSITENFNTKYKRQHIFDLETTKGYFGENISYVLSSDFKNKEKFVSKIHSIFLSMNFPESLPSGMIHEDIGKRHVLWDEKGISAIVDFDRSYYGKIVLDLGQACRGWCFTDNWTKWSNENFKALIKGYSEKRKLTKDEKRFLVDAIKFGIIERSISFCLRFIRITKDPEDERYALYSVLENGLADMVERNRTKIEDILKEI